jgi:radical SAM superfamily enzyme YgiQ (UPF0313 family)
MVAVLIIQLPSPPRKNVFREWSGGMGTALDSSREEWGHDPGFYDVPYAAYLYIARRMEQLGIPFRYFDLQARERIELQEFDALIADHRPRVLVTQVNIQLVARARAAAPGLRVILVGATAKWFKERILGDGIADVVMEEGEELLVAENIAALLAGKIEDVQGCSIWRDGKVTTKAARLPMKNLDFVDFPAYELLDFSRYESAYYGGQRVRYATVFTTKGCPYSCGYCPYPYGFGHRLIYRSPARVGADIERLAREFGVRQILFRDQVFTVNPRHAKAVCEELIRRDLGISWVCETRYDLVDEATIDLMARAGCSEIHYGLESADETMFAAVAKTDGPKSLDLFEQVIGWTRKRGLRAHVHLIVGMPDESAASARNTKLWLRRVKPDSVQLAYFVPYPGTPLFDELRASGELGEVEHIEWEKLGAFSQPVIRSRHLSIAGIRRAREQIAAGWKYSLFDRAINQARRLAGMPAR